MPASIATIRPNVAHTNGKVFGDAKFCIGLPCRSRVPVASLEGEYAHAAPAKEEAGPQEGERRAQAGAQAHLHSVNGLLNADIVKKAGDFFRIF